MASNPIYDDSNLPKLTPKQKRFVEALPTAKSQSEAAREAGYSHVIVGEVGCENLKKPKIAAHIEAQAQAIAARNAITHDSIAAELESARQLAENLKQPAPMVSASMGKAKLAGLIVDKNEDVSGRTPSQTIDALLDTGALPIILARAVELGKLVSYELPQ